MKKIVFVQVPLYQEDMIALKQKSGMSTNMDALAEAVRHYLACEHTQRPAK